MSASKSLSGEQVSVKGWNWGYYHFKDDKLCISSDKEGVKTAFKLRKEDIVQSNESKATEVTIEFN
jgi:hypothetical protein